MKILSNLKPTFYNVYTPSGDFTILNINENQSVAYRHTNESDNNVLVDLLHCHAYGTALLYLNENYELEVGKFNDIFTESNNTVEDYYSDCEELLTKNVKIVEEAGIPLININGYQIFEGDGYILRGNGKKKIMESFNEDVTKPDEIENLAGRLVDFAKGYDPYDFDDQYNSEEEAFESFKAQLLDSKKLAGIISYIEGILNDFDEETAKDDFTVEAFDLLKALKELQGNNINEDAEGTQTTDIAPKVDQELGLEKPKKKYYDILLSDISESLDILNKGFLKNSKGQYQRGNYILVKEGAKYLAIHKDKLKEDIK